MRHPIIALPQKQKNTSEIVEATSTIVTKGGPTVNTFFFGGQLVMHAALINQLASEDGK